MRVKLQLESFFSNFDIQNIPNKDSNFNSYASGKQEDLFEEKKNENKETSNHEKNNITNNSFINDYEELLRKHESEIRNHIKIQHQYRIYSDNLKTKIEELEKSKMDYKKNISNLQEVIIFHFLFLLRKHININFLKIQY